MYSARTEVISLKHWLGRRAWVNYSKAVSEFYFLWQMLFMMLREWARFPVTNILTRTIAYNKRLREAWVSWVEGDRQVTRTRLGVEAQEAQAACRRARVVLIDMERVSLGLRGNVPLRRPSGSHSFFCRRP